MKPLFNQKRPLFILAVFLVMFFGITSSQPVLADSATLNVTGEIASVAYGTWNPFGGRRATILVKDSKGKEHTVFVGIKTTYVPRRTPVVGDKATFNCFKDNRGLWAVTTVTYK